jgi:hypothetical protein
MGMVDTKSVGTLLTLVAGKRIDADNITRQCARKAWERRKRL